MRRVLRAALVVAASAPAWAAPDEEAAWIRYAAISPDGAQICFERHGDLWVLPSAGGEARRLTIHESTDLGPVWSPDGRTIAFASDRHGNFDVFTMPARGGPATRLTFHSAHDRPSAFTPDGSAVYFASARVDAPQAMLPTTYLPELYTVSLDGGRAKQVLTTPAGSARPTRDGRLLVYEDRKGYENEWRKHHRSPVARDVWSFDAASGAHRNLTASKCEDRDPVPAPDGKSLYWLCEESGSFNVWRRPIEGGPAEQVTKFATHPVRFLSVADTGVLAFTWNGDLFTLAPGAEPVKLAVRATGDEHENAVRVETLRDGATAFAVSPDEREVAFIVRGEVFVASVEHGTTKRVTFTPGQERSLAWAPDGRTLYYSAERGSSWGIWRASIARAEEPNFFQATRLAEEAVLVGEDEVFQPALSPDGKKLAYLRNRDAIEVMDLAAKTSRTAVPAERNYSYADGDIQYEWSPDSRWLAFTYVPRRRWISDVGVVEVETGRIVNVTDSGYEESQPHWSPDGRALFFLSDRLGRRSHGSWGSDADVFAQDLTQAAADRAALSREEFDALRKKEEEAKEKAAGEAKKEGDAAAKPKEEEPPPPVEIEPERLDRRVRRATIASSPIGGYAVSKDGENVVYTARIGDKWDLWLARPRDEKTMRILELGAEGPGEVVFGKEGKSVYLLLADGAIVRAEVEHLLAPEGQGDAKRKDVRYAAEMTIDGPAERASMFEHAWRQVRRKFYDPSLHGVDWDAMKANYARFLPHVATNHDFAEMLSEMLGELNASHTGSGFRPKRPDADQTAALGLVFDPAWDAAGLRVAEVLPGGPCAKAGSKIAAGVLVTAIDGVALAPSVDPAAPLNRKAGKWVLLDLASADGRTAWQEAVKPVELRAEADLLYERWVERCRDAVAKASGGRVGYVHVRGMNESSFRRTFSDVLGRHSDAEALVVDTRFNGGGWLHDDLCGFLNGRPYLDFVPRGKERGSFGGEPLFRWARPTVVLMSEGNYSDAHLFPYAFKALGIGKLVGAPVAGTGTAVWWETLLDPTLYFGIPQVGMAGPDGRYVENQDLDPDVLVLLDPREVAGGTDAQLLRAVETVLAEPARK